jgi:signal transduction histidine kinase
MALTQRRPLHVLLIEDQEDDELLLRRRLSEAYDLTLERVDTADGMRRALAASQQWDVVVSDYSMPSFTALDALRILHEDGRDLPFFIVSGTVTDEMAVSAMRAGAHDYVMKDNVHRLKPAIERELKDAAHRRARRQAEAERDKLLARERDLREAAEAAARLKDEFLAVLSHELRTPLTSILGWARMLRLREGRNPSVIQSVDAIERNGRTMTRLVDDLLDLSAILSGKLQLHPRMVDFSALVGSAIDAVAEMAYDKEVMIDAAVAENCRVCGDADRLKQIVVNLLRNAVKFTPKNGRIRISLERSQSEVILAVRDTGIGIPGDFLPYVFDRFRQADSSSSREFGGLGLGLSIVRQVAQMHGGRVAAESDGAGRGATFILHLPAITAANTTAESCPAPMDHGALRGRTVLFVGEDPEEREFMRSGLEEAGATVVSLCTSTEALDALEWARADVLIVDLNLTGRNGYELIRSVRQLQNGREIPAIALSAGGGADAHRNKAVAAGFNFILVKPVPSETIVASVLDLLQQLARH